MRINYTQQKQALEDSINKLRELAAQGEVEPILERIRIIEEKIKSLRDEERERIEDIRQATTDNIKTERELTQETLTSLNQAIEAKAAEKESCNQLEDGVLRSRKSNCISRIDADIRTLNAQKNTATNQRNEKIKTFQENEDNLISQISEDTKLQIDREEERLILSKRNIKKD